MKQDERDMLIKVCTTVDDMKENQDKMDLKLDLHIQRDDNFLTKKIAVWIGTIIITIGLGAFGYTAYIDDRVHTHQTNMAIHQADHMQYDQHKE